MSEKRTDDYDLMEKGEAAERPDTENHSDSPLPSPALTENSQKRLLEDKQLSNGQLRVSWASRVHRAASSWRLRLLQKGPKITARSSIVRTFAECPEGYPRLAAFLDSDENFMLYRRFGFLQSRLILYKQDKLRELEQDLVKLDNTDAKMNPKRLKSRQADDAKCENRKDLIDAITVAFNDYAKILKSAHELAGYSRASARDYQSVKNYFDSNDPLRNSESYIYHKEDMITLKPGRERAWLDSLVEKALQRLSCPLVRWIFCSEELRRKTEPGETQIILYSRTRIDCCVSFILTLVILGLLIIPVYILWHITLSGKLDSRSTAIIVVVLLVFTLTFSGVLSLFTRARRHEILAAAAGYCAVLVVFIGNINQLTSGP